MKPVPRLYRDQDGGVHILRPGEKLPPGTVLTKPRLDDLRLPPAPEVRRDN